MRGDGRRGAAADVDSSDHGFVVSGRSIRFGLDAVERRRPPAVEAIISARGSGRPFEIDLGLLRAGRRSGRQRARDRVPGEVRGARLDRRPAPRDARGTRLGPVRGTAGPGGLTPPVRARSSTSTAEPPRSRRPPAVAAPGHPRSGPEEFDQRELLRLEKETSARSSPRTRSREVLDALRAGWTGRWPTIAALAGRGLGDGRVGSSRRRSKSSRRAAADFVMLAGSTTSSAGSSCSSATPRRRRPRRSGSIVVITVRGRVDKEEGGKLSVVVHEATAFEPGADEVAAARAKAQQSTGPLVLRVNAAARGRADRGSEGRVRRFPRRRRCCSRWNHRGRAASAVRQRLQGSPVGSPRRARSAARAGGPGGLSGFSTA